MQQEVLEVLEVLGNHLLVDILVTHHLPNQRQGLHGIALQTVEVTFGMRTLTQVSGLKIALRVLQMLYCLVL